MTDPSKQTPEGFKRAQDYRLILDVPFLQQLRTTGSRLKALAASLAREAKQFHTTLNEVAGYDLFLVPPTPKADPFFIAIEKYLDSGKRPRDPMKPAFTLYGENHYIWTDDYSRWVDRDARKQNIPYQLTRMNLAYILTQEPWATDARCLPLGNIHRGRDKYPHAYFDNAKFSLQGTQSVQTYYPTWEQLKETERPYNALEPFYPFGSLCAYGRGNHTLPRRENEMPRGGPKFSKKSRPKS